MVPHEVIEDALGHALRPKMSGVQLLVAPFNPTSLGAHAVDEAECGDTRRVVKSIASQYIGTGSNSETDEYLQSKMGKDVVQLGCQFIHSRIDVAKVREKWKWLK